MDKIIGRDIDISTIENLNLANLNCLNSYKDFLDLVEYMHKSISCEQLLNQDEKSNLQLKVSDEIITELAQIAQQYVKITFLLDKLENSFVD